MLSLVSKLRGVYMCQNIDAVSNHDVWFLINICHIEAILYPCRIRTKYMCSIVYM